MGRQSRQSRQARRAQERRQLAQRRQHPQRASFEFNWQMVAGLVVILAFVGILGFKALSNSSNNTLASATATIPNGPSVEGIGCDQGMPAGGYHIHAHLTVLEAGKSFPIGQDSGHYYAKDCLFWLHAHDPSGLIHFESPQVEHPPLSAWLGVLARTNPGGAPNITPGPGQTRKVYVNGKLYIGNPANIKIYQHENIWIELGPPFSSPQPFDFKAHGV
jgi:hypothetical protein